MPRARPACPSMCKPAEATGCPARRTKSQALMRARRHLSPSDLDNFGVLDGGSLVDLFKRITGALAASMVGIVAVFLVIGGVVIMNVMLATVTERTREIGLRKSLGARRGGYSFAVPDRDRGDVHHWRSDRRGRGLRVRSDYRGQHAGADARPDFGGDHCAGGLDCGWRVFRTVSREQGREPESDRSVAAGDAKERLAGTSCE